MRHALLASALACAACSGPGGERAPFTPRVGFGAFEPAGITPDPDVALARIGIEEVLIVDCEERARHPVLRRGRIDLVSGDAELDQTFAIPPGEYCALEVALGPCGSPDFCAVVAPYAVEVEGVRRSDAADVEIHDEGTVETVLQGRWRMSPGEGVLLTLDLGALVAGLAIASLPAESDGVVRVSQTTNESRLVALRDGLRGGLSLRRDLDGDGALDPDELEDPPLAEPEGAPPP